MLVIRSLTLKKIDEIDIDESLSEFVSRIPSIAWDIFEEGEYNDSLEFYYEVCERAISQGSSPLGHYVKAHLHSVGGKAPYYDSEKATQEMLKSALLGNVSAVIGYCSMVDLSTVESFSLYKAAIDSGCAMYAGREDFDYYMASKSSEDLREIEDMSKRIISDVSKLGLKFREW